MAQWNGLWASRHSSLVHCWTTPAKEKGHSIRRSNGLGLKDVQVGLWKLSHAVELLVDHRVIHGLDRIVAWNHGTEVRPCSEVRG